MQTTPAAKSSALASTALLAALATGNIKVILAAADHATDVDPSNGAAVQAWSDASWLSSHAAPSTWQSEIDKAWASLRTAADTYARDCAA